MGFFRALGRAFWRFMVIFSFIVNIVLVVVLLVAGVFIFEIKAQAEPLIEGLHSSFVGLDEATIDWTIPVRDQIQVELNIPLETDTVVVLTEPVPLEVTALIDLPGINAFNAQATVNLELPAGLELPVALDLDVPVDEPLDVELDVRAVIPLNQTQLHDVAENLRLQLEPVTTLLNNLPDDFGGAAEMVGDVLRGDPPDLLAPNDYSIDPWPGYSITAGVGYEFFDIQAPPVNQPIQTGIVPVGGMPFLDEQIRPELYDDTSPQEINAAAIAAMEARGIDPVHYRGGLSTLLVSQQPMEAGAQAGAGPETEDQGIIMPEGEGAAGDVAEPLPTTAPPPTMAPPTVPPPTATPVPDQGIISPGSPGG